MIWHITKRELFDHINSLRFILILNSCDTFRLNGYQRRRASSDASGKNP